MHHGPHRRSGAAGYLHSCPRILRFPSLEEMMVNLKLILLILALLCFVLATVNVPARGANLLALGLALTTLALMV